MNKINYCKKEDYLIPNLVIKIFKRMTIILKNMKIWNLLIWKNIKSLYTELMLNGTLSDCLVNTDKNANKRITAFIK